MTLIEVVGVMAVLAVVAVVVVPVMLRVIDDLARRGERRQMTVLVEGLKGSITRTRAIPGAAQMAAAIAVETGMRPAQVTLNGRRANRVFWVEPAVADALALPYVQAAGGFEEPPAPRWGVLILSSLSRDLPAGVATGVAPSAEAFEAVWNAAPGTVPDGWNWGGDPDGLIIGRLNLSDLFLPLTLNYDTWTARFTRWGRYAVDGSAPAELPELPEAENGEKENVWTRWFLQGTVLGLHSHQGPNYPLQASQVLRGPESFVYEVDTWRGELFLGVAMTGGLTGWDLQAAVDLFMRAPANINAKNDVTQVGVTNRMVEYLLGFINWSEAGFPSNGGQTVRSLQQAMEKDTYDYLFKPEVSVDNPPPELLPGPEDPCWCGSGKKFKNCHGTKK